MSSPGPITDSVAQLQRLVAESTAFQTRIASVDPAVIAAKILSYDYLDDPVAIKELRPFAVVWPGENLTISRYAGGSQSWLKVDRGDLILILTDKDNFPNDRSQSAADFVGWVDQVLMDIIAGAGKDDRLTISEISFKYPPARNSVKDEQAAGAYYSVAFLVSWGQ